MSGIDWEEILGAEGDDLVDAYEASVPTLYSYPSYDTEDDYENYLPEEDDDYEDDDYPEENPEAQERHRLEELVETTPGSFYYDEEHYCYVGNLNGVKMSFNSVWGKHKFTEEEVARLFRGETISISYVTYSGKPRTTTGRLMTGVPKADGTKWDRFVPSFDKHFVPNK